MCFPIYAGDDWAVSHHDHWQWHGARWISTRHVVKAWRMKAQQQINKGFRRLVGLLTGFGSGFDKGSSKLRVGRLSSRCRKGKLELLPGSPNSKSPWWGKMRQAKDGLNCDNRSAHFARGWSMICADFVGCWLLSGISIRTKLVS